MTPITRERAEHLWYMAAGSELGLTFEVRTGDIKGVEKEMYEARNALGDPDLTTLSLKVAADGKSITIYKNTSAELPE